MSDRVLCDAIKTAPLVASELREELFALIMGDTEDPKGTQDTKDIYKVNARTLANMTDEQRQELYDQIIAKVTSGDINKDA
jgi:hypothetical protein